MAEEESAVREAALHVLYSRLGVEGPPGQTRVPLYAIERLQAAVDPDGVLDRAVEYQSEQRRGYPIEKPDHGSRSRIMSDYATLDAGEYGFYYGYESADPEDPADPDAHRPWKFTVRRRGELKFSRTAAELGIENEFNCGLVLLEGVGAFMAWCCDKRT